MISIGEHILGYRVIDFALSGRSIAGTIEPTKVELISGARGGMDASELIQFRGWRIANPQTRMGSGGETSAAAALLASD